MKKLLRKVNRISMSVLLIASLVLGSIPAREVQAAKTICESYRGSNVESQNYSRWTAPMESYLTPLGDGTLMRVQYGSYIEGLLVEYYDENYNIISSKIVAEELPIFGGFYATGSNYFVVTGQKNTEESNTKEVYRITKYDKNWNKIKSAGLSNCNTTVPFDAGSCRMDVCGKYLLIRTSHEMYRTDDGLNHQSNVTIELDMDTMTITDSYTKIMNSNYGYVSHSFNQFIKIDNNKIVAVDHGDGHPRSIALLKYQTDVSKGSFEPDYYSQCTVIDVLAFPGASGENTTGASVGGFEISNSKYLVAGNSVVQDSNNLKRTTRNVFVASVDKSTSAVNINWLTSYGEGDGTTSTPQMVKISDNKYVVLWSRDGIVYYTSVNGSGVKSDEIYSFEGNLSDCVPVASGDKLVWYTWKENVNTFYDININNLSQNSKTEIVNGHQYEHLGVVDGVATLECKVCQQVDQIKVATSMTVFWNDDGGDYYSTRFSTTRKVGDKLYYWIEATPEDANEEMEIISSDPSIASVTTDSQTMGVITIKNEGTVKITIRPKYNPDCYETYNLTVAGVLECEHVESNLIIDVEATCTTVGIAHTQCIKCGELLKQNIEIPTTSHNYSDCQFKDEATHTGTCKVCGELVEEEHQWDIGVVTKSPTLTATGEKTYTCTVCGFKRVEVIEELLEPAKPSTGGEQASSGKVGVKANQTFEQKGMKYKVAKVTGNGQAEVTLVSVDKNKKSVTVPATVTYNGVKCKVTAIPANAFSKCKKLTKVTIGKNVKSIGKKAFYKCKKLKRITIKSKILKKVGKQAIKGIHKKAVIKVPKKKKKAYKKLFNKKSGFVKTMKVR